MYVENEGDIIYAQLDFLSEGQRPRAPRANIQKPVEDNTVYANIAVFQPKPQQEDNVKLKPATTNRRNAEPFTLKSDTEAEKRKKGLTSSIKIVIGISVIFVLVGSLQ